MQTSRGRSTWNLPSQLLVCPLLLLFFTQVLGDSCPYNSKTVIKKVSGEETTYMDTVGHPLELFCSLSNIDTETKLTSKNLFFQRVDQVVNDTRVRRVNDTTISLRLKNQKPSKSKYYCYLNIPKRTDVDDSSNSRTVSRRSNNAEDLTGSGSSDNETVCWNLVEIGSDPKKVDNISCTVYHWQELNCTWHVPINDVQTNYTVRYEPVLSKNKTFPCPNDDVRANTCKWTMSTKPPYRKDLAKLKVTVTGVNVFNKTETSVVFDQFSILRPKGPEKLKWLAKTSTSIQLEWSIGEMQNLRWTYKILYKTTASDWTSILCDPNNSTHGGRVSYNVTNLSPNTLYNFRVFMKPYPADDNYWSTGFAANLFRTK